MKNGENEMDELFAAQFGGWVIWQKYPFSGEWCQVGLIRSFAENKSARRRFSITLRFWNRLLRWKERERPRHRMGRQAGDDGAVDRGQCTAGPDAGAVDEPVDRDAEQRERAQQSDGIQQGRRCLLPALPGHGRSVPVRGRRDSVPQA